MILLDLVLVFKSKHESLALMSLWNQSSLGRKEGGGIGKKDLLAHNKKK